MASNDPFGTAQSNPLDGAVLGSAIFVIILLLGGLVYFCFRLWFFVQIVKALRALPQMASAQQDQATAIMRLANAQASQGAAFSRLAEAMERIADDNASAGPTLAHSPSVPPATPPAVSQAVVADEIAARAQRYAEPPPGATLATAAQMRLARARETKGRLAEMRAALPPMSDTMKQVVAALVSLLVLGTIAFLVVRFFL